VLRWVVAVVAMVVLVKTGLARRAWWSLSTMVRNGRMRAIVLLLLTAFVLIAPPQARAAEIAPASAEDTLRCSWGGYQSAGKIFTKGYCYFPLTAYSGEGALITGLRTNAGNDWTPSASYSLHGARNGSTWESLGSSAVSGVWEIGPQTSSNGKTIPAGAAMWRTTSSTLNYGSWAAATSYNTAGAVATCTGSGMNPTFARGCKGYWLGLNTTEATIDANTFTGSDWFPGGSSGTLLPFCGATATITSPGSAARVYPGNTVTLTWTRTALQTGNIEVRWKPDVYESSSPWFLAVDAATVANSGTTTLTVPDLGTWNEIGTRVGAVQLRCRDVPLGRYFYKTSEDPSSAATTGARPCYSTVATWPLMKNVVAGETAGFYFSHSVVGYGGAPGVTVQYATWDDGTLSNAPAYSSLTWTTLATLSAGSFGTYNATAGYNGTMRQFVLRCTDDQGTVYDRQWASAVRLIGDADGSSEEGCYAQTGIGASPSSWVPGLGRVVSCTLRVLFVPDADQVQESWDGLLDTVKENAPAAWVYDAYELVKDSAVGTQAAVTASASGCVQVIPDGGALVESEAGSVCPATMDIGVLESARPYLGFMVWVGWAWTMYSALFRKAPPSTEPEQLTLF